jgi:phospholipase A1
MRFVFALLLIAFYALSTGARAQNITENRVPTEALSWQQCSAMRHDDQARLACFDRWTAQESNTRPSAADSTASALMNAHTPLPDLKTAPVITTHNCKSTRMSELSRFWELETGSDCGTFGIRGYQPISLSWLGSDSVNNQPTSPAVGHTATTSIPFGTTETRISLSVRTKIAQGLLTHEKLLKRDSLWFAYSQQSNWQIFSGDLSRPFRTTDHEPELIYIYPTDTPLPLGWRLRYSGLSLNHQSNGQPLEAGTEAC